jgi:predicted metalloprotease with PDZ domain
MVSLDDVMRQLWQLRLESGAGIETHTIQDLICSVVDSDLHDFLHLLIYTSTELPLEELLATVGVELTIRQAGNQKDKGGKPHEGPLPAVELGAFLEEKEGGLAIARVREDGAAQCAGLSANDVIVAVNGLKLTLAKLEQQLLLAGVGEQWKIHAFRRDELMEFDLELIAAPMNTVVLQAGEQHLFRKDWLKDD